MEMKEQNFTMGLIGGVVAAVIGAIIWALITVTTNYQIGWMAVGVGILVGYAVRTFGKGTDTVFGVTGAVIALLGCVAGNLLTTLIFVSQQEHMDLMTLLSGLTPGIVADLMKDTFQPMDLLFYGLAVYEAYKFSIKPAEQEEPAVAMQ